MAEPIGALRAVLSATSAAFEKDMGRARQAVRREGSAMQRTFGALRDSTSRFTSSVFNLRNAAAAAAGAAGLGLFVKQAIEGAAAMDDVARMVGITAEELQELRFVAAAF